MEAGEEGIGETIQELAMFFSTDDGLVASPQTKRLKRAFNILTDLFDGLYLHTNMWKMVIMACRPCYIPGGFSESAYMRRVMGVRTSYQERLRRRVECPECEVGL